MNDITKFEEHLCQRYGKIGTDKRTDFEIKAKAFALCKIIMKAIKEANLTQVELAQKTGTRKNYISKIENGNNDIELSTLFRFIEVGFGRQINLTIS